MILYQHVIVLPFKLLQNMKLYIKNMVSICCKRVVKSELKKLGVYYLGVQLGEIEIQGEITECQREKFRIALQRFGLDLLEDRKTILMERIKNLIVEIVYSPELLRNGSYSDFIARRLHYHYTYLSNIFSRMMGTTIEQYLIVCKIERAKELISYDELNLTEISFQLNYCSMAHMSNQFKKITGLTPSQFRKMKGKRLYGLDER